MAKSNKNKGLNNPALSVVGGAEVVKQTASVIPFLIKTFVIGGVLYFAYSRFFGGFKKINEIPAYGVANISLGEAQNRAEAIYQAMLGYGANLSIVQNNISGLNYNGWIRVYNAFGERKGVNPLDKPLDLVGWFFDQFNQEEIIKLRFVLKGVF